MKKVLSCLALVMALAGCQSSDSADQNAPLSLRGATPVADTSAVGPMPIYPDKGVSVERSVLAQPPVIPHKADHPINLDKNGCVNCHRVGKRKMHESHFEGKKVDGQFYQCLACHAPQAENY